MGGGRKELGEGSLNSRALYVACTMSASGGYRGHLDFLRLSTDEPGSHQQIPEKSPEIRRPTSRRSSHELRLRVLMRRQETCGARLDRGTGPRNTRNPDVRAHLVPVDRFPEHCPGPEYECDSEISPRRRRRAQAGCKRRQHPGRGLCPVN